MKAIWKGNVIAQSDKTIVIESTHYFPEDSIKPECFVESNKTSYCPWKGEASYFSISVDGDKNQDAAWHYQAPKNAAKEITGMVAFWRGVEVTE